MRQSLAEFEAGLAARQVLSEGKAALNLALDWFKREMNLASSIQPNTRVSYFGVALIHLYTTALLLLFALAMVAMYFFKMRRAAALFGRVGPNTDPTLGAALPLDSGPASSPPAAPTPLVAPSPPGAGAPPASAQPPSKSTSISTVTANWRGQLRVACDQQRAGWTQLRTG